MTTGARGRRRPRLFLWLGAFGLLVAVVGFGKTFFVPLFAGTFSAHPLVHVHGALLFSWVAFFPGQAVLVHRRKFSAHRTMGWLGAGLAVGVVLSTLAVGILASRRVAAGGDISEANAELFIVMLEMALFSGLFAAALLLRKRPETHKRLMLLALIGSLGPAWFRFRHYFPDVDNPAFFFSILLADSLILIAAGSDFLRNRRVHWVYPVAGGPMVLTHLAEVFLFDSAAFRAAADAFAGPLV